MLSKEDGQGRKEGKWWRFEDNALPIGSGEWSGWGGERSEGTHWQPHSHPLLVKQERVFKSTGDKEAWPRGCGRSCCARPPGALTSGHRPQSTSVWARSSRTNCSGSYSPRAAAALALPQVVLPA